MYFGKNNCVRVEGLNLMGAKWDLSSPIKFIFSKVMLFKQKNLIKNGDRQYLAFIDWKMEKL